LFLSLAAKYRAEGYRLYLVGGAVRDILLNKFPDDLDLATDATPAESLAFLSDLDSSFARFGVLKYRGLDGTADIATFRRESVYSDHRHPSEITFVKDPKIDSFRRDFTINALYLDDEGTLLDFHGGKRDLEMKTIRFIGNPETRIKEDPLRICRAERFATSLDFVLAPETQKAVEALRPLLKELNPAKLREERRKGWKGSL